MEMEKNIIETADEYINRGLEAFSEKRLSEAASIVSDALQLLKKRMSGRFMRKH